jgi:nucleoside-diphosphate-sugar epimerase
MDEVEATKRLGTAFVTGGSGFVGRELVAALAAKGIHVRALARSDKAADAVTRAGATPVRGDVTDRAALAAGVEGCDAVFHAAAYVQDWGPREEYFRTNVEATSHLLEAAARAGVATFVFIGTEASLADGRPIVRADESRPYASHPAGLYPLTKGLAEAAVLRASSATLRTVSVRPRLVWGRGDTSVLPKIVERVKAGQFAWIDGGRVLTSSCHVKNLAHAALLAADKGRGGEAYFVTDGEPRPFRELISAFLRTQGVDPPDRSVPRWLAWAVATAGEALAPLFGFTPPVSRTAVALIGVEVTVIDAKARSELGYAPVLSIEEGLAEMRVPNLA